jgi:hypothetical protein
MADNLLRFIAWQNPLTTLLALAGVGLALRGDHAIPPVTPDGLAKGRSGAGPAGSETMSSLTTAPPAPARASLGRGDGWGGVRGDGWVGLGDGTLWPLAAGFALTLLAMLPLSPFQGFGWGFRYLHGLLGSASLLAAAAWVRWVRPGEASAARGWAMLGAATAFTALVAAPIQFAQARALIAPFANAQAAIRDATVGGVKVGGAPADVVIVDETGVWYAQDLVRNDPFLTAGPKVMSLQALTEPQLRALCGKARVALFDRTDARRFGVLAFDTPPDAQTLRLRAVLAEPVCAMPTG